MLTVTFLSKPGQNDIMLLIMSTGSIFFKHFIYNKNAQTHKVNTRHSRQQSCWQVNIKTYTVSRICLLPDFYIHVLIYVLFVYMQCIPHCVNGGSRVMW